MIKNDLFQSKLPTYLYIKILIFILTIFVSCKSKNHFPNDEDKISDKCNPIYDTNKFHVIKNIKEPFTILGSESNFRFGAKLFKDAKLSEFILIDYGKLKLSNGYRNTNIYSMSDSLKINSIYTIYKLTRDLDGAHNENSIYLIKANHKKVRYYYLENYNTYCWQVNKKLIIADFKNLTYFINHEYLNFEANISLDYTFNSIIKFIFKMTTINKVELDAPKKILIKNTNDLFESPESHNLNVKYNGKEIIKTQEFIYSVCPEVLLYFKVKMNKQELFRENLFRINSYMIYDNNHQD